MALRTLLARVSGVVRTVMVRAVPRVSAKRTPAVRWYNTTTTRFVVGTTFAATLLTQPLHADAPVNVVKHANILYDQGNSEELLKFLTQANETQPHQAEILWRLARAEHDVSLTKTGDEKKKLVQSAHTHATEALQLDPSNFACHKWAGITLSDVGDFLGSKDQISNAFTIRDHFAKATELNPTDATSRHLLGVWCFTFADMNWAMRQLAGVLFATPPSCSYQQALDHFLQAEKLEPGFYKKNTLMVATCYNSLGQSELAKQYVKVALSMPSNNADDNAAHADAVKLSKTLGL